MRILTNHIGYEQDGFKRAVLQAEAACNAGTFRLVDYKNGQVVYTGACEAIGEVARWNKGYFYTLKFHDIHQSGEYYLEADTNNGVVRSFPFQIRKNVLGYQTLSDVGYYFKAQRDSGEIAKASSQCRFRGDKEGVADVHGGWYDATGDFATYLSHLTFSAYFNPQQIPIACFAFFKAYDLLEQSGNEMYSMLKRRFLEEAMFGADWLYRMHAPSGSFYRSVNRSDAYAEVASARYLAYGYNFDDEEFMCPNPENLPPVTDDLYESSFRSGAGLSIACLAYAARKYFDGSDYTQNEYITLAKDSYRYMQENNDKHTNDGKSNFLDYYCELVAVTELFHTTGEICYKHRARQVADKVLSYLVDINQQEAYWSVDGTKRPFFHAADAGLPVVALLNYYEAETLPEQKEKVLNACIRIFRHELSVTNEVANPFHYARHLVSTKEGELRTQFFFRHDTETGSWWQGDNARICSLSTAARYLSYFAEKDFAKQLNEYADSQLDWILGLNPYDACMMQGQGRNNIRYFYGERYDFIACPGGIVNGITGGLHDEDGIDFFSEPTEEIKDNWRWAEQWIPHAAWYLFAVAMKKL